MRVPVRRAHPDSPAPPSRPRRAVTGLQPRPAPGSVPARRRRPAGRAGRRRAAAAGPRPPGRRSGRCIRSAAARRGRPSGRRRARPWNGVPRAAMPRTVGSMMRAMIVGFERGRHQRGRGYGAHAARVGAGVAVADALVVLRRAEGHGAAFRRRGRRRTAPRPRETPRSPRWRRPRRTGRRKSRRCAASASASVSAMITPLPAASPSALITTGNRPPRAWAFAAAASVNAA